MSTHNHHAVDHYSPVRAMTHHVEISLSRTGYGYSGIIWNYEDARSTTLTQAPYPPPAKNNHQLFQKIKSYIDVHRNKTSIDAWCIKHSQPSPRIIFSQNLWISHVGFEGFCRRAKLKASEKHLKTMPHNSRKVLSITTKP